MPAALLNLRGRIVLFARVVMWVSVIFNHFPVFWTSFGIECCELSIQLDGIDAIIG
jgi:hypothetical protein